jgi:hypothetical protein
MFLSPKVSVFGQWLIGEFGLPFCHLVFQHIFHKSVGIVLMINGHLTGFIKAIRFRFFFAAQIVRHRSCRVAQGIGFG